MKFLSRLTGRFFKKKHPGMVRTCIHMSQNIIHPCNMMEELGIAVATDTREAVAYNSDEIILFDMFDFGGDFIGSFYALKRNGLYYGNIVGRREIVACETDAFRFVKTDLLKIPFMQTEQTLHAMLCRYNTKTGSISPILFGIFEAGKLAKELHRFSPETPLREAMEHCYAKDL